MSAGAGMVMGVLAWEDEVVQYPGNLIHPLTFGFPTRVARVPGACYSTVVERPSDAVLASFVSTARSLEAEGVGMIVSTTGLSVLFQREIAAAVAVPVITSSLLLVPFLARVIGADRSVGIVTAGRRFLTAEHLAAAGIDGERLCIKGIDHTREFQQLAVRPTRLPDDRGLARQAALIMEQMCRCCPRLGAVVVEVTGLCGQSAMLRRVGGIPVLDIVEVAYMMRSVLVGDRWSSGGE